MTNPEQIFEDLSVADTELDAQQIIDYENTLPDIPEPVAAVHYVDNEVMLAAYIEYQESRQAAIAKGEPEPELTRYLGECILKICNHTAYNWRFINYSFRDEMVSDAIENCIRGINTFDPTKSKYIFSYYTTAAWNAFLRRIARENSQSVIKGRIIADLDIDSIVTQEHDNSEYQASFIEYMKLAEDYKLAHEKRKKIVVEDEVEEDENALVFDGD